MLRSSLRLFLKLKPDYPEARRFKDIVKGLDEEAAKRKAIGTLDSDNYARATPAGSPRWSSLKQPLKVYVPATSTASGYVPQYQTILIGAFKKWEKKTDGRVRFEFLKEAQGSDIDCQWTGDIKNAIFESEGGHAHGECEGNKIKHVKIFLLTVESKTLPHTDAYIEKLALHEIGHALGIRGHSDVRDYIMFFSIGVSPKEGQVSNRDAKTFFELYK